MCQLMKRCGLRRPVHRAVAVSGLLLLVLSVFFLAFRTTLFNHIMDKELVMSPSSPGFDLWLTSDVPIAMRFYLWNVTNADEVARRRAKPRLQQLGPYVFQEKHRKVNLTWNDNGTVTYMQVKSWFFQQHLSTGSLDDSITTLNVPLMTVASMISAKSLVIRTAFNLFLATIGTRLFVTHSARQFLFDGYSDALLEAGQIGGKLFDLSVPFDRFGWFYGRNNSQFYDGVFTMATGSGDIATIGTVTKWNGSSETSSFAAPCSHINGTTGELFPPRLPPRSHIQLYTSDLCRSLLLPYRDDCTVLGLRGRRYEADHMLFASPDINPDNACFCNGQCPPSGLLNETLCKFGAPAFISFPHMLFADPAVRSQTQGQRPDVRRHNFSVVVEPITGVPLTVRARFQVNMHLSPNSRVSMLRRVPDLYMPMVWFENTVDVSERAAAQLSQAAVLLPLVLQVVALLLLAVALALLVAAVVIALSARHAPLREQKLPVPSAAATQSCSDAQATLTTSSNSNSSYSSTATSSSQLAPDHLAIDSSPSVPQSTAPAASVVS